jgi:hypothetical protein
MKEIFELLIYLNRDVQNIIEFLEENQKTGLEQIKDQWVDSQQVMQMLNISPRTLSSLRSKRVLPYSKINRKLFYRVADLEEILESTYSFKPPKLQRHGSK